jgi:hypothetical protein
MRDSRFKAIKCKISRGGFSDERVFAFEVGGEQYQGVASRRHMWSSNGKPIEDGEPPLGKTIDGLVAARILEVANDQAIVSIPDGEVVTMPLTQLVERPTAAQEHVPL